MAKSKTLIEKKTYKAEKKSLSRIVENDKFKNLSFLLRTLLVVFFIYSFSFSRPWLPFDERIIYQELLFPTPQTINEIKEIISAFVLNYHIESMNTFFSSHLTIRSNPIASILLVITSWMFKKNAFFYHLLQLSIHIINVGLVWLILNNIFNIQATSTSRNPQSTHQKILITSIFAAIWGLHSANTEAVLLTTNWTTLLTYTFCLGFILYEITRINKNTFKITKISFFTVSILFCAVMFFTEYAYTMPFIIFFFAVSILSSYAENIKKPLFTSFKITLPYFAGLSLFVLLSLAKKESPLINLSNSFYLFTERNLWLAPQIFIHLLKLMILPLKLSPFQSDLTTISPTLISFYSVTCSLIYLTLVLLPIFFISLTKNRPLRSFCFLTYAFLFSLLPFLHILLPTYCLSADRYCYFPSFFLVLLICYILKPFVSSLTINILVLVLILLASRTAIRIMEWNNPYDFYKSAAQVENNLLYKAHKQVIFASYLGETRNKNEMNFYLLDSLKQLDEVIKKYDILVKKYTKQPETLKQYGIDYKSLLLKAAYLKATIKHDNYKEDPKKILDFYEPYIKKYLKLAFTNQIAFYAELLSEVKERERAKEILEYGLKKFPYASSFLLSLSEYYLQNQDLDPAFKYLQRTYELFPNDPLILEKLYRYYMLKNDLLNQAKFAYLIGLRNHDPEKYKTAVLIFLKTNQLDKTRASLQKLIQLSGENPITLLLSSSYLELTGKRDKVPELLTKAYTLTKKNSKVTDYKTYKSILTSLININLHYGKIEDVKKYLNEFENIKELTKEEFDFIKNTKNKLRSY